MAVSFALSKVLPNPIDVTLNFFQVYGVLTLTGSYGGASTHGDTLALGGLCPSNQIPIQVTIWEAPAAGTAPTGYQFGYAPGTTQNNGVLTIFTGTSEYSEGSAYSAGLLAAVLYIQVTFPKFI